MKKSCKNINLRDRETVSVYVKECLRRHCRRQNTRALICRRFGVPEDTYQRILDRDEKTIQTVALKMSDYIIGTIRDRDIPVFVPKARERRDQTTDKLRLIGCEPALQQFYDYVAVRSCDGIWARRLVPQQCSSIRGRGQVYGMRMIRSYVDKYNRAADYAARQGLRYNRQVKYFVKLDIRHCYQSVDRNLLMDILRHDCGNEDILYLWQTLLDSYGRAMSPDGRPYTGLLIGALPSQWGAQLILSYAYRYAMALPGVSHGVFFMDDMLFTGSSRRKLKRAVEAIVVYVKERLHLEIKPTWHIKVLADEPIDMMGYVIHQSGKVTMRARNFIHSRRLLLRAAMIGRIGSRRARRLVSYKGFYDHSDSFKATTALHAGPLFKRAQSLLSKEEKHANLLRHRTGKSNLRTPAGRNG